MSLVLNAKTWLMSAAVSAPVLLCGLCLPQSALALPPPPPGCSLPALTTFHVDPRAHVPLIDGEINGRKVQLVVGVSSRTAVYRSAAKALDILEEDGHERVSNSPALVETGHGWIHDLELDDMPRTVLSTYDVHENFGVAVEGNGVDGNGVGGMSAPAMVLGAAFWSRADDDFDLRANSISLVRPVGCAREDTLPFNGGAYSQTRLLTPASSLIDDVVTVFVDGVPLRAEIDTGSNITILTRQGAAKLSHDWPLPNAQPQGQFTAGQGEISWAKARFKTFSIGEETIQNPTIVVADIYGRDHEETVRLMNGTTAHLMPFTPISAKVADMILGADFFRAHHVLISNSRRMVYFVYNDAPFLN